MSETQRERTIKSAIKDIGMRFPQFGLSYKDGMLVYEIVGDLLRRIGTGLNTAAEVNAYIDARVKAHITETGGNS